MVQSLFPIPSFFKIKFMFKHIFYAVLLFISTVTTQCSKTSTNPDDSNSLPPETQTGAGTFACKINGVVWKYNNPDYKFLDTRPHTNWSFDPNNKGGDLEVVALKYYDPSSSNSYDEIILFGADSLNVFKEKILDKNSFNYGCRYEIIKPTNKQCGDFNSAGINDTNRIFGNYGKITITRLDQSAKIISGTFNCTIIETGCDTLKITEGRFDIKYQ